MERIVDAEVGIAHHMRVARRRQHRSRRYPASVSTTPQPYPTPPIRPFRMHVRFFFCSNISTSVRPYTAMKVKAH